MVEVGEQHDRMIARHRLDIAKLLFGKDGGYSLRKFKRIYKREMAENPHLYEPEGHWRNQTATEENAEGGDGGEEVEATAEEKADQEETEAGVKAENVEDEEVERDIEAEKAELKQQLTKEAKELENDSEEDFVAIAEEDLEAILEDIEKAEFATEEEAAAYMEEKHEEFMNKKMKLN